MNAVLLVVFVSVILLTLTLAGWLGSLRAPAKPGLKSLPPLLAGFHPLASSVGIWLGPTVLVLAPGRKASIEAGLVGAALEEVLGPEDLVGYSAVLSFWLGFAGFAFFAAGNPVACLLATVVLGLMGWLYPRVWLNRVARTRRERIARQLPYAIDLITVSMQAGQDFMAALRVFIREYRTGPLPEEFARALREADLGKGRVEALQGMAARVKIDEFSSLVGAVSQSYEMGSSIAETLKIQADLLRKSRQAKAEQQAARAPSVMMIPVVLFIVPAFFMILVVPVIMRVKNAVSGL